MTTLYLQRIEISNFRAYGDNFSLSLPGPGVTILTGPQGLGKSTFFEAIEWALTGRVRRLEGLLARREQEVPVARYGVSLEFVNGEGESTRIERRAVREQESREQFAEVFSPAQQAEKAIAIAAALKANEQAVAVLEANERRRGAELRRDTLLQLSAARTKIAQGVAHKTMVTSVIDRHTHEMWMIQPEFYKNKKTLQRIKDLDSQIRSLLVKQEAEGSSSTQVELEAAQAARDQLPDSEYLNDYQAGIKARIDELTLAIKKEHEVVAQIEKELLPAQALQQQHPELLSALGKLPSEEANAIDEAGRAVEQLIHQEQQLLQSFEQWPALLLDEPLQHQDPARAAAFIEVLSNLVRDRKYQAILSIHDEELADSLRRKLEVAGIECVTCRYSGMGSTGVLCSTV